MNTRRKTPRRNVTEGRSASRPSPALVRHLVVVLVAAGLLQAFWLSRPSWSPDMRLWKAFGDVAVVLLFASLALGPAARLHRGLGRGLAWRRQVGIWTAVAATVHGLLVIDGWARWSVSRFMGYEFIPQLGREARMEPGFGLANLLGLVALVWLLVLLSTSFDRALRLLGPAAWKWLHSAAYVVFYLVVLHSAYFLFVHYTLSFHRPPAPENWFRWPMVGLALGVLALQAAAFARTVRRRRSDPPADAAARRGRRRDMAAAGPA